MCSYSVCRKCILLTIILIITIHYSVVLLIYGNQTELTELPLSHIDGTTYRDYFESMYAQQIDLQEKSTKKHIILVCLNKRYIEHFVIWYLQFKTAMISMINQNNYSLLIITLDIKSYLYLSRSNIFINSNNNINIEIINALNSSIPICKIPASKHNYFDDPKKIYIFRGCYIKYLLSCKRAVKMA